MNKILLEQAIKEQEFNAKLAKKQPEKQIEFAAEYFYSNPNDFDEMKKLYEYYGYRYSRSLWVLQKVTYNEANERNLND
jgi:hypothetical protein